MIKNQPRQPQIDTAAADHAQSTDPTGTYFRRQELDISPEDEEGREPNGDVIQIRDD